MPILFGLLALIGWGAGDIFATIITRKVGNRTYFFGWLIASLIITSFYIPFAGPISSWQMLLIAFFLSIVSMIGTLLYFAALEKGIASLVGAIAGSFSVVTVPIALILFGERLTFFQGAGIIAIVCGLILSSIKLRELKNRDIRKIITDRYVLYALISMVTWGIYWALVRIPVESIGWFWAGYPGYFFFVFLLIFRQVNIQKAIDLLSTRKISLYFISTCLLLSIASFSYNIGLTYGYTSIVAPIAGSSPVLFVILARFIFKEKLTGQQKAGIVAALVGIVLIAVS